MDEDTRCPACGSTNVTTQEEPLRPWVLDATCNTCGHTWKASNA
jgi:predicted nucleic-acid-binding Zn-ribbon protein